MIKQPLTQLNNDDGNIVVIQDANDNSFDYTKNLDEVEIDMCKCKQKLLHNNSFSNSKQKPSFFISSRNTTFNRLNSYDICNKKTRDDDDLEVSIDPLSVFGGEDEKKAMSTLRRYTAKTIEKGKAFFKLRFIQEKILETNKIIQPLIKQARTSYQESSLTKGNYERKSIKIISLFLKKIEKAIFSFNLKRYQESYAELINNKIINTPEEYGEILLVIKGFDKAIIGEFLSKQKGGNKSFIILKAFMKSINYKDVFFLDALRFLFSRISPPMDAGLTLIIIEEFSNCYYEDNQEFNQFKDSNVLYLLSSSVLSLNTIFTRTDIKKLIKMPKEDFVKINADCPSEISERIYDELIQEKMDITHDYTELIYRRLCQSTDILFPKEKESNTSLVELAPLKHNLDQLLSSLKEGDIFTKYSLHGPIHQRYVKINESETKIIWTIPSPTRTLNIPKSINITDIQNIFIGANNSKVFNKYQIPFEDDNLCISIISSKRSLDLQGRDKNTIQKWFNGLNGLISKLRFIEEFKETSKMQNGQSIMNIINYIWKTEILPHWDDYRKYIIQKKESVDRIDSKIDHKQTIKESLFKKLIKKSLDKNEFDYLWNYGLPKWVRKQMWPLIIGNSLYIHESLFDYYHKQIEVIDFEELHQQYMNDHYCLFSDDKILNQILLSILKIVPKFSYQITESHVSLHQFMQNTFQLIRIYDLYRPDIPFSKHLIYISIILLLNTDSLYQAYVCFVNMIIKGLIYPFLLKDDTMIDEITSLYHKLLQSFAPQIEKHMNKFEITPKFYLINWLETCFIKTFPYTTLLRLWDRFLLKGEMVLFQVALAIISIQQKELLHCTITELFSKLKQFPYEKYSEEDFFEHLNSLNITSPYNDWKFEKDLSEEKGLLFKSFLDDDCI